jgi:hypothetical protein
VILVLHLLVLSGVNFTGNHILTLNKDGGKIYAPITTGIAGQGQVNIAENTTIYNNIGNGGLNLSKVHFTADEVLTLGAPVAINAPITTAVNGTGTIMSNADIAFNNAVGAAGASLKLINAGAGNITFTCW